MTPGILEKDVWVCWVLDSLFTIDDEVEMAFKGGTSLSKAYNAIARFSEDIDVTIASASLNPGIDPFDPDLGGKARRRMSDDMNARMVAYVVEVVEPHFRQKLSQQFPGGGWDLDISGQGEVLNLTYPTVTSNVVGDEPGYIREFIKIEFGGRMATSPVEEFKIVPYISVISEELYLPVANVQVLSGQRTFWEKATLVHAECNRTNMRMSSERMSRHWYDLYKLADSSIGHLALADRDLLVDVVRYKKIFYNSASADYDACLNGRLILVPTGDNLGAIKNDYEMMVSHSMIYADPPLFDEIITRLTLLELQINSA